MKPMISNSSHNPPYSRLLQALMFIGRLFSPLYSNVMRLRSFLYQKEIFKKHRLPVQVISVGNLVMGGTGKTPVVMHIAALLKNNGRRPVIISRGYRGRAKEKYNIVADGSNLLMTAEDCGDEPRLLAENLPTVPVLTAKKRINAGRFACGSLKIDTIILDDGFQHLALHRDLDLVVFTARSLLDQRFVEDSRCLPGGELREPFSALARAHAFIITGIDESSIMPAERFKRFLEDSYPGQPVFLGKYQPVEPETTDGSLSLAAARKMPLYAFCGIAVPEAFSSLLRREGFNVVGFKAFHDHQAYDAGILQDLDRQARAAGARALITTAKDLVKIKLIHTETLPILPLNISLQIDEKFNRFILERLANQ